MKRIFTFILFISFSMAASAQSETLAKWTFPCGELSDTIAETASTLNTNAYISTMGGTGAISMKNGATTKAAQADGWDNGMDAKAWKITINTTDKDIFVSSKQQSGGTDAGPRDFKLQYYIGIVGDSDWIDVPNGTITVANDWTTSELINLPLASECNNQSLVFIRWVMTSNNDINGVTVLPVGKTKIDDIEVKGEILTAINDLTAQIEIRTFPNPCKEFINIEAEQNISKMSIFTLTGQLVHQSNQNQMNVHLPLDLTSGIYMLRVETENGKKSSFKKIIVR